MRLHVLLAKNFIKIFVRIIRRSKDSIQYLFDVLLKDEIRDYFDNQYNTGYKHIEKVIAVAKKLDLPASKIIDIGGADGTTSVMFSNAFPSAKIFVFEPIQESFHKIELKALENKNLVPINKAIGNFKGTSKINIANRITSSSLLLLNADKMSDAFGENLKFNRQVEIEVSTLDDEFSSEEPISIIKIDVQGFELEVLKGGINTLKRTDLLLLEVGNHDGYLNAPGYYLVDEFLRNNSFVLYDIFPSLKDRGRLKEWDVIYIKGSLL
jgi:FkbM family methyltransferase